MPSLVIISMGWSSRVTRSINRHSKSKRHSTPFLSRHVGAGCKVRSRNCESYCFHVLVFCYFRCFVDFTHVSATITNGQLGECQNPASRISRPENRFRRMDRCFRIPKCFLQLRTGPSHCRNPRFWKCNFPNEIIVLSLGLSRTHPCSLRSGISLARYIYHTRMLQQ
jgi:hypothetical protein